MNAAAYNCFGWWGEGQKTAENMTELEEKQTYSYIMCCNNSCMKYFGLSFSHTKLNYIQNSCHVIMSGFVYFKLFLFLKICGLMVVLFNTCLY